MDVLNWIANHWDAIIQVSLQIIGGASVLAKVTPSEKDNLVIDILLELLHLTALNPKKRKARWDKK